MRNLMMSGLFRDAWMSTEDEKILYSALTKRVTLYLAPYNTNSWERKLCINVVDMSMLLSFVLWNFSLEDSVPWFRSYVIMALRPALHQVQVALQHLEEKVSNPVGLRTIFWRNIYLKYSAASQIAGIGAWDGAAAWIRVRFISCCCPVASLLRLLTQINQTWDWWALSLLSAEQR
jgi:hypothetical protein